MTPAGANPRVMTARLARRRAGARVALLVLACLAALWPASVAMAQSGSGVPLGSAKKLSSAPPSSSTRATTSKTTSSTSTSTATTASRSSTSSAKQLPFTGYDVPELALIGGALLLAGLALCVCTRDARAR
jgi:hypothetical protein